jgi:AraC family transcriptional regulator
VSDFIRAHQSEIGRVTLFEIAPPVGEHAHPHVHFLFKASGADRGLLVDGKRVMMTERRCIRVAPWVRHADDLDAVDQAARIVALYIDPDWFANRYPFGPDPNNASVMVTDAMRGLVGEIAWRLGAATAFNSNTLEASVAELIDLATDSCLRQEGARADRATDFRIRRAIWIMKENPHLWHNFDDLARQVGLSRSRFFEQFREAIGVPPAMFASGLVVERAIRDLMFSDRSIVEISEELGFSAQSNFCRFFKDKVGFPPSDVRRAASIGAMQGEALYRTFH